MSKIILEQLQPVLAMNDAVLDASASGRALLDSRRFLGLSQKEVAGEMGVSATFLCDIEHGRRHVSVKNFNRVKSAMLKIMSRPTFQSLR